ncbi:MAG TPA: hypothetical protein VGG19_19090 [Tepidisphaeraceae bacterium]
MGALGFFGIVAAAAVVAVGPLAHGQSFQIVKIADTSTAIPLIGDAFTRFSVPSGFAFVGQSDNGFSGVYEYVTGFPSGSMIDTLASTDMTASGFAAGVDYAGFSSVSDGAFVQSFIATTTIGVTAVYSDPAKPVLIAETGESSSSGIVFNSFTNVSGTYDNNTVTATGEFLSNAGIYFFSIGGGVRLTQEATTTPPSSFSDLGQPNFKAGYGGATIFGVGSTIQSMRATSNGVQGIYYSAPNGPSATPGAFTKLVDTTSQVPGGAGDFTSFGDPAANNSDLVFTAHYNQNGSDQQGIFALGNYLYDNGGNAPSLTLEELVASGAVAPGSGGAHFEDFLAVTPNGTFLADLDNGTQGIYRLGGEPDFSINSSVSEVIDTTDLLGGKAITSFGLSNEGDEYEDGGTSFLVNFADGSQGIYYFLVPEPGTLSVLGVFAMLVNRKRKAL